MNANLRSLTNRLTRWNFTWTAEPGFQAEKQGLQSHGGLGGAKMEARTPFTRVAGADAAVTGDGQGGTRASGMGIYRF